MNWIRRKILEWVYADVLFYLDKEEVVGNLTNPVANAIQRLTRDVKDEHRERVQDKITALGRSCNIETRLYNLINRKHADNADAIQELDAMIQMLASEFGYEFKRVEEKSEHLVLAEREYENE